VLRVGVTVQSAHCIASSGPGVRVGFPPGQTRYFQGWYRNPGGPCGTGFNLTNGLGITFH
jgi:hypothetical protein